MNEILNQRGEAFSNKVLDYVQYRPSYPQEAIDFLVTEKILTQQQIIAEIGHGTGKLTEVLLNNSLQVVGIEPNDEMRDLSTQLFATNSNFQAHKGFSENTNFQAHSIDIIIAANALHWFDITPTLQEFQRIVKPNTHKNLIAIWNKKNKEDNFTNEYIAIADTNKINNLYANSEEDYDVLFQKFIGNTNSYEKYIFRNVHTLDLEAMLGRYDSISHRYEKNTLEYATIIQEFKKLYRTYQVDGKVNLLYDCTIYIATI